ncbi:MAG: tandem-95 repeat protein, partial [Actinobacteria bacterium]|nr:tandem-95 repeat protein [Actinomycetota bacterium]
AALVAADDTVTATSGEALDIDVLANDTGNAPLVVDAVGTAAHGTVSIVAGTVRYTPDAAWTGPDSFTYTVSDALAYTATATVAVTVDPPALVAGADTATTDDGTPTTVSPLGNDSGFGALGATLLAQPAHGTVTDNGDGTFGFAPEAGWQGTTTFTYTLTDGLGRTATGTVGVTVGPRAAAAADDAAATDDASPVTVSPLGNDVGFGSLAVDAFSQPAHGTVTDNGDGTLGFAPEAGWQGSATFTYTLADSAGQHDDGTVTVTVTPRALSTTDDTAATDDATAVDVDVLGDDSGFGTLAVDAFTQPAHGTVTDNGDGTLRFAPQAGEQGTETFGYTVTDSAGQNGSGTVTVTVAPRALVPGDDSVSTDDTSSATVDLLGNDDGFGTLAVTGLTQPAHGTVTDNGDGTAGFTPEPGWTGTTTFTYSVTDAAGQTATGTVTVTVGPAAPPAPTAADDTASTDDASGVVVHVLDNDSGTGSLTITSFTQPDHGTVTDNGDGTLTLTPEEGWTGTAVFTYTVTDSGGGTAVGTVEVTVGPRLLVATDDTGSTDDATATTVDVLANDTGFGTLTVDAFTQPAHGTVTDEGGGTLGFAPEAGWTGTASFTYDVSDAAGGTGTATVDVTVTGSGDGGGGGDGGAGDPVDDDASVAHDGDVLVDVLANDPDGATLDAVGTDPEHGTAVVEEGGIRYTPDGTFAGTDSFTYTVAGSGTAATVTVEVTAPDLETADDEATAAHGGVPVTVDVLGNDTGSGLTVTEVSEPAPGGAATVEDGAVVLTPADGFRGDVTFTYTVTDVVGSTATATVTVTVPNARPTVSPVPGRTLVAGTATTFTLTVADADPDDDPAVTAGVPTGSAGAGGAVRPVVGRTAGGAPTVRLTVAATFSGTVAVPVAVSDGHSGGTATTVLRLVVSPVAAAGVGFGVVPNPDGRAAVGRPEFDRWGWPVARQLSTRIDSRITWRVSATTSVSRYDVRVDGAVVCTVPAALLAATQSCTLPRQALRGTEVVTVTAAGAAGTSTASRVPPTTAGATSGHLLAVVYFPAGRFALDRTAQKVLRRTDALADVYGLDGLRLVGHTDWDGTPESNQRLSERRAAQVAAWMTGASARVLLSTAGRGESEPAVSNRTYSGKAANRRVEIWVG